MKVKLIEIRDRATFIPAVAISVQPTGEEERYLMRRVGYGVQPPYSILLTHLAGSGNACCSDPYDWANRTWQTAHVWIAEHWDEIESGAVVDVEFILGETSAPKFSERLTASL